MTDATIRFQCSGCGKRIRAPEAAAGRAVKCSGCGSTVQVPSSAVTVMGDLNVNRSSQPPEPSQSSEQMRFDDSSEPTIPLKDNSSSTFAPWRWIDNVFDFRFRRYLTPYIIRAFWILALVGTLVFLVQSTLIAPFSDKPDIDTLRGTAKQTVPTAKPSELSKSFSEILAWVITSVLKTIGCILLLMFIRVAAELAIVVFNISKDLKRLENQPQSTS